jgi:hypothetical protein
MAISKIKRWILDKNTASKRLDSGDKLRLNLSNIALVAQVSSEEDIVALSAFINDKERRGNTVSCLLISSNKDLKSEYILDQKNIKWTGEPKGEKVSSFLSKQYDILYCPTKKMDIPLEHLVKKAMAIIKVGVHSTEILPYMDICADTKHQNLYEILNEIDLILNKLVKNG